MEINFINPDIILEIREKSHRHRDNLSFARKLSEEERELLKNRTDLETIFINGVQVNQEKSP